LASFDDLAEVVRDCGPDAEGIVADVTDRDALVGVCADAGALDAVVCAAGAVWGGKPLWEVPETAWRAMVEINLDGAFHTAVATVPLLLARPEPRVGRFVAIASAAGSRGLPMMGAYSAAKHGVIGLVRSLAADLSDSGITANAVAPGSTDTAALEASAAAYDLATPGEFAVHHTIGRLLGAEEIAEVVAWLCSPSSSAVTGSVLAADGGMTAI
jgi:SDR family mycofactocin-dependent oxidoreductase